MVWLETLFYSHRSMLPALFTTILSFGCQKGRATRKRRPSKSTPQACGSLVSRLVLRALALRAFLSACAARSGRRTLIQAGNARIRCGLIGRAFTVGTSLHAGAALVA